MAQQGRAATARQFTGIGRSQRGVSLLGLLFWAVVLAFGGVVLARVFPAVMEYYTLERVVGRIASENPATVPAVREAFTRAQQIEYSIISIGPQDLQISKENDKVLISFAYDKEIPLAGPVYLLIKFEGRSR
ncbi:DUF4845 domain-containing protein [Roseateles koreensis]|uniref:DUF4845 domain-containing protein n=1 Tax=Roseateles koreensis TaxID=2987526 RepID=A0ABT5KMD8_9BURK|nr:DUF4845 domain-containing protein [Roseateles koreensis]MDC8784076.1 DUF4845 domain-containing protein [Roseateles koreensis]